MGEVYLDYNSTTPLAPEVISTITQSLTEDWANPSSSSKLGAKAQQVLSKARVNVASMINASSAQDIIFTSGGSESNNMAIHSAVEWGQNHYKTPHVVLSNIEHVATSAPVKHLASKQLIDFSEVQVNKRNGCLQVEDVLANIKPNTVLVTLMMANNETGVIFPIEQISRELKDMNNKRKHKVWFHVDAAQTIGKINVDVEQLGVDYMTIVGHKFYGPRIGALYVRSIGREAPVRSLLCGGGQERGFRPGTENTPMIAGLGAASLLVYLKLHTYSSHMKEIRDYLLQQLQVSNVEFVVNCEQADRLPNTASLSFPNCCLSGVQLLEQCPQILASTTAACHNQSAVSEVLLSSGVPLELARSTVRISVGRSTSRKDVETAVEQIKRAMTKLS